MSWLIDTDVLSEPMQKSPQPRVVQWLKENQAEIYTSSITIAELSLGIERLPAGQKRKRLEAWFRKLLAALDGRILSFNTRTAVARGKFYSRLARGGEQMALRDSFIAAIAIRHGLVIARRNVADFQRPGLRIHNPFDDSDE